MTKTWCVGEKHKSITNYIIEYEKVNPKTKKLGKIIKGTCSICGRNKSQFSSYINDTRRMFIKRGKCGKNHCSSMSIQRGLI